MKISFLISVFIILLQVFCYEKKAKKSKSMNTDLFNKLSLDRKKLISILMRKKEVFPLVRMNHDSPSYCSDFGSKEKRNLKLGTEVYILNILNYRGPESKQDFKWQVLYNDQVYCINGNSLSAKISFYLGSVNDTDQSGKFVIVNGNRYISIANNLPPHGEMEGHIYPIGTGSVRYTKEKISFCEFKYWWPFIQEGDSNHCFNLVKKKKDWVSETAHYFKFKKYEI